MNNLDRNTLVENFTGNTDMNHEISNEHRSVIDYLVKNEENLNNFQEVIGKVVNTFFSEELRGESFEEIKYGLLECNLYEYVDDLVDIYNEDLIKSYFYFDTDIQLDDYGISDEDDDIIIKVLKQAQFEGYLSLFIENPENEEHFKDLLFQIELLHKKVTFLLLSIDMPDDVFAFFHRLDETLFRLEYIRKDNERYQNDYKLFWRTLWEVFTGWSLISGYSDIDFVEKNLKKI